MKILHISYHDGCIKNLNFVLKSLGISCDVQKPDWNYNIGHDRALEIWNNNKDYYNSFDLIITSDTAPLSRILLQNNFGGKLIIWICNRFDYADQATNDCNFPDKEYYELIRRAATNPQVKIFSYTPFEHEYARKYKNVEVGNALLRPCAFIDNPRTSLIPNEVLKEDTFFIPPYHNDTIFMDLQDKCKNLKINAYCGKYAGPNDLKNFKAIIHIPYAWSNLALFENWFIGNVYFIPSKKFLIELSKQNNFWWQDKYAIEMLDYSEWYLKEHANLHIYFDSWQDLKIKSDDKFLLEKTKKEIKKRSDFLQQETISLFKEIFTKEN